MKTTNNKYRNDDFNNLIADLAEAYGVSEFEFIPQSGLIFKDAYDEVHKIKVDNSIMEICTFEKGKYLIKINPFFTNSFWDSWI